MALKVNKYCDILLHIINNLPKVNTKFVGAVVKANSNTRAPESCNENAASWLQAPVLTIR